MRRDTTRAALLVAAALASTWAAGEVTSRWLGWPKTFLLARDEAAPATPGAAGDAAQAPPADPAGTGAVSPTGGEAGRQDNPAAPTTGAPTSGDAKSAAGSGAAPAGEDPGATGAEGRPRGEIEEVGGDEVAKAIREAEEALGGKDPKGKTPDVFRPTKPLPADIPIALPSDI